MQKRAHGSLRINQLKRFRHKFILKRIAVLLTFSLVGTIAQASLDESKATSSDESKATSSISPLPAQVVFAARYKSITEFKQLLEKIADDTQDQCTLQKALHDTKGVHDESGLQQFAGFLSAGVHHPVVERDGKKQGILAKVFFEVISQCPNTGFISKLLEAGLDVGQIIPATNDLEIQVKDSVEEENMRVDRELLRFTTVRIYQLRRDLNALKEQIEDAQLALDVLPQDEINTNEQREERERITKHFTNEIAEKAGLQRVLQNHLENTVEATLDLFVHLINSGYSKEKLKHALLYSDGIAKEKEANPTFKALMDKVEEYINKPTELQRTVDRYKKRVRPKKGV